MGQRAKQQKFSLPPLVLVCACVRACVLVDPDRRLCVQEEKNNPSPLSLTCHILQKFAFFHMYARMLYYNSM